MSSAVESDFIKHLLDLDSMEVIAREGIDPSILPTEELQPIYEYALKYFFDSGKTQAVTVSALQTYELSVGVSMLDTLNDLEITLDDPDLEIHDVIEKLKSQYISKEVAAFNRSLAMAMADAPTSEKLKVASSCAMDLISMVTKLEPRRVRVSSREGVVERLAFYEALVATPDLKHGMSLGLKELDDHILMIHPGEICTFAAYAKYGKSIIAIISALAEWKRGRRVVLFTLENSIDMTLDRIITTATKVDSTKWQEGSLDIAEKQLVDDFTNEHRKSPDFIQVVQPESGHRSVQMMLRQAQILDAESVIIDQLSHIEHPSPSRKPRNEQIAEIMRDLKLTISTAQTPLPVLLFHQMKRVGRDQADKVGYYQMDALAESAEVERGSDFVFSGYQSNDMRVVNQSLIQVLAARRVDVKWWDASWIPGMGYLKIRNERPIEG
jgi:replicative DNA helicase